MNHGAGYRRADYRRETFCDKDWSPVLADELPLLAIRHPLSHAIGEFAGSSGVQFIGESVSLHHYTT
jgi:hypothetical protein